MLTLQIIFYACFLLLTVAILKLGAATLALEAKTERDI